jgi:23S rRNA (guanosine2251-2'-O)-methyltransferase
MAKDKDTFIYGIHPVIEALQAGKTIDKVWIQEGSVSPTLREILGMLRDRKIIWKQVPQEKLNRLVNGTHQGIIVSLSAVEFANIEDVIQSAYDKGEDPFIIVLDGVTDIRNFGAIARTAACAGVHGIVVPEKGGAAINSDAVKTSAGALFKIPVCRVQSIYNGLKVLKNSGVRIAGATEKAEGAIFKADLTGPVAIVMGDEEKGLSSETRKLCDELFRIPLSPDGVDSLNVSVAAGVALFEVVRQRSIASI